MKPTAWVVRDEKGFGVTCEERSRNAQKKDKKSPQISLKWEWHVQELLWVGKMGFEGCPQERDRNNELRREQQTPRAAGRRKTSFDLRLQTLPAAAGEGMSTQGDTAGKTPGMTRSQPGEAEEMFYKLSQRSKPFSSAGCLPVEAQLLPKYFSIINEMQIMVYYPESFFQ